MKKTALFFAFLFLPSISFATNSIKEVPNYSRFEKKTEITVEGIVTPKVVRFETNEFLGNQTVLLDENNKRISHKWTRIAEKIKKQNNISVTTSSQFEGSASALADGNLSNNFAFHPEEDKEKKVILRFPQKTEVSGILVHLDEGIISPQKISVRGEFTKNKWTNIVDGINFSPRIPFPKVSVHALEISYQTRHFLRLNEIEILGQEEIEKKDELIFFAEEGKKYTLLGGAHFGQKNYYEETHQPLSVDNATPTFKLPLSLKNPDFNNDFDGDGLADNQDLCPKTVDFKNTDKDNNGRGDVCEDPDLDHYFSPKDNCPFKYNPNQTDSDQDGIGDECDEAEVRWTENQDNLLWIVFIFGAGMLGGLIYRSMKKS